MSCCAAAWICSVSSIRLLRTWARTRSISSGGGRLVLEATTRARRWSTSLPVMTSPLTIAVALRMPGSCLPTKRTLSGMSSWPDGAPLCAAATIDSTGAISTIAALGNQPSFIIPPVKAGLCPAPDLLNRSLAVLPLASQIAQRHPDQEGVPAPRVAAGFIVAPPGQAKLDAIVVVGDAEPVADRARSRRRPKADPRAGW